MIRPLRTDSKSLLMIQRRLIGLYLDGSDRSPEPLKTGHTEDVFHDLGKDFSFRQRLNNFVRIGDISGEMFFKTTTGISSGPVAFEESRS